MNGEIFNALERTREQGMAVEDGVSMEDRILLTCSGYDLEPNELIHICNQMMEHVETVVRVRLDTLDADLDADQRQKLMLSVRSVGLATFIKAFGGGMALMEERAKEAREGVEPSS